MIYVDKLKYPSKNGTLYCHMWSDEDDAVLDEFAIKIGLKLEWSHTSNGISGRFYHYDLVASKRKKALEHGAVFVPLRKWIRFKLDTKKSLS